MVQKVLIVCFALIALTAAQYSLGGGNPSRGNAGGQYSLGGGNPSRGNAGGQYSLGGGNPSRGNGAGQYSLGGGNPANNYGGGNRHNEGYGRGPIRDPPRQQNFNSHGPAQVQYGRRPDTGNMFRQSRY